VLALFRSAGLRPEIVPVTLTPGDQSRFTRGGWQVCENDLIGALQAALGQSRLKLADVPERPRLLRELRTFGTKRKPPAQTIPLPPCATGTIRRWCWPWRCRCGSPSGRAGAGRRRASTASGGVPVSPTGWLSWGKVGEL
jgi:hypothetical protein